MGSRQSYFPSPQYRCQTCIGKGAYGTVYAAVNADTDRAVAVKEFKRKKAGLVEIANLELLASFNAPNTVKIYSWWCTETVYLSMELLSNNTYDVLLEKGPYGSAKVASIANDVFDGLRVIHRKGYVHCDLKPENIVFTNATEKRVKIVDFGLLRKAPILDKPYAQSRYYRAPEVVLGLDCGPAIDMWSMGCIIIELLTGVPLFPALDEPTLLAMHKGVGALPEHMLLNTTRSEGFFDKVPDNIARGLPDVDLREVVEGLLAIDPAERSTAESVAGMLCLNYK